jgi:hypothetical protein
MASKFNSKNGSLKSKKTTRPPGPFSLFVQDNREEIKTFELEGFTGRGSLIKKAGILWNRLKKNNAPKAEQYKQTAQRLKLENDKLKLKKVYELDDDGIDDDDDDDERISKKAIKKQRKNKGTGNYVKYVKEISCEGYLFNNNQIYSDITENNNPSGVLVGRYFPKSDTYKKHINGTFPQFVKSLSPGNLFDNHYIYDGKNPNNSELIGIYYYKKDRYIYF